MACAVFWMVRGAPARVPEPTNPPKAPEAHHAAAMAAPTLPSLPERIEKDDEGDAPEDPKIWEKRLERAKKTLSAYLEATRYPPGSRPMSEHPDLRAPHHVQPVNLPLARKDRKVTDARVTLRQDRFFAVGDEAVTMEITCSNSDGPLPCDVVSAQAMVPPSEAKGAQAPPPEAAVPFASGSGGTALASFQPSKHGFAQHHGTIRVAVELRLRTESGSASFDLQYTPAAPAVFTGNVREALAAGSLDFSVEVDVAKPGRYTISGRVEDRDGRTFAYVTFNDELTQGRRDVRLRLFGKLIRDESAHSPFRLRDIEGYLLRENAFPDRELMSMLEGPVLTSRAYQARDFSDASWDSDDKRRHVAEFEKDVKEAERHTRP